MGLIKRNLMIGTRVAACAAGLLLFTPGLEITANAQEATAPATQNEFVALEGPSAVSETYQDWVINCQQLRQEDGAAVRNCAMSQELRQASNNQLVLMVSIAPPVNGNVPRATIVAPFGLDLSQGVGVVIDGNDIATVPFITCMPAGCIAEIDLEPAMLDKLQSGETAQVVLLPRQSDKPLLLSISLAGFTNAWNRLNEL